MSALMEDTWSLLNTFAFILLQFVVLIELYEENAALHRYVIGKGGGVFY